MLRTYYVHIGTPKFWQGFEKPEPLCTCTDISSTGIGASAVVARPDSAAGGGDGPVDSGGDVGSADAAASTAATAAKADSVAAAAPH